MWSDQNPGNSEEEVRGLAIGSCRSCRRAPKNTANVNMSQATAWCSCPSIHHLFGAYYITPFTEQLVECGSVAFTDFYTTGFTSTAASMFTPIQALSVHEQLRN